MPDIFVGVPSMADTEPVETPKNPCRVQEQLTWYWARHHNCVRCMGH